MPQHPAGTASEMDGVVHSVKGCTEVKQQQDVEGAGVCRGEVIVAHDFDKCSFSVARRAETRLKGFVQVIGLVVGVGLGGNDAFQGFVEEWQVGDGAVV